MTDAPGGQPPPPPNRGDQPPGATPGPEWWSQGSTAPPPPHQQPTPPVQHAAPSPQQPGQYQPGTHSSAPSGGQPAVVYVQTPGTNGLAIASLVLGIVWLYWLGSILAVIFGHVALSQIKKTGQSGRGLAIAGVVLGWIGVAFLALAIVGIVAAGSA